MDIVFKALADKNRRQLLDGLRVKDGQTLNELCAEMAMSRQAVSKHLRILEQAKLVNCLQRGRNKHHYLNPIPLQQIVDRWLSEFRQSQAQALTQLKKNLEKPL
jgi:predicted transcriptional regulator